MISRSVAYVLFLIFSIHSANAEDRLITTEYYEISLPDSLKQVKPFDLPNCIDFLKRKAINLYLSICIWKGDADSVIKKNGAFEVKDGYFYIPGVSPARFNKALIRSKSGYISMSDSANCALSSNTGMHTGECYTYIRFGLDYSISVDASDGIIDQKLMGRITDSLKINTSGNHDVVLKKIKKHLTDEYSPSFDCIQAPITYAERLICSDYILSLQDSVLAKNYKALRAADLGDLQGQLLADQRAWLKERQACKDDDCLATVQARRIKELCKNYPVKSGEQPECLKTKDFLNFNDHFPP